MSFIVIEGDNGTGKDTLALNIENTLNYKVITNNPYIQELNNNAKQFNGKLRIQKFLDYSKQCGEIANLSKNNVISVRYWLSTLASAYSDNIYTYKEVMDIEKNICSKFKKPDLVIYLWCDYDERIKRIKNRKSPDFDDITKQRSIKYQCFLKEFQKRTNIKYINIDTTYKNKVEVFNETCKYL